MNVDIRFAAHPKDVAGYKTDELREHFLIEDVMKKGNQSAVYSMYDRMITAGIAPTGNPIVLETMEQFTKAEFFLQRREMGVINTGGAGKVNVDGEEFSLEKKDCLYIGKGKQEISFDSIDQNNPAEFYINSCPAHNEYPTVKATKDQSNQVNLGSKENCNERTIFQYIHEDGIQSCQLVMGVTELKTGSIWNTFPPHTHHRRMEVYFYFDLPEDQIVMHFMGEPQQTRHLAIRNKQAVISPEWSIHSGAGTSAYSFIWGMAGENKAFTDMDGQELVNIK